MEQSNNIGKWSAEIDNSGKTDFIMVTGTFPTNGEKPLFHLRKNYPQGINQMELLLTLVFGTVADPTGKSEASVVYSEFMVTTETYNTVLMVDDNHRHIASIDI